MTRRKGFVLLLTALIVVFVIGGVIGVFTTRERLLADIDARLRDNVSSFGALYLAFPDEVEDFAAEREGGRAVVLVGPDGTMLFERAPTGALGLGFPDLSVEEIVARPGEVFTVPGLDVDHSFRVFVGELDGEGFLVIAEPLKDLRQTLRTLARVLFATLLGVVAMLGLMFSWLARLTLEPYDEIIDTADAIIDGDLDRRVASRQADPEVERLVGSINRMLDQNQEALAAQVKAEERVVRFAAEASHELRTPLATIAGYSEVYLSGASTEPVSVEKQMSRINSEATRLGRLVESMLTITRLDNEVDFEFEPVDLVEVARAAVADAAFGSVDPEAAERLSLDEGDVESLVLNGDRDSLYQVVANLLANAEVHAPGSDVVVALASRDGDALITVADDGPGMRERIAEQAFDRFYRGSPTSDSGTRTTGLGLSIAEGIVKAHGGAVHLVTAPGEGTTVTIRLPLSSS